MAGAGRAPDRPGRRGIPWQPVRGPAARRPDRAGRRQRTGGPVRRRTAAGRGFHLGPRRLHRRALQSAGADQSSRRLHPARPVHQSRLRAGAGCPAHGRADRAGRGPEPAADRPAGHHRRRRSRIAGRHLHADAVHLRPDARRLPRRDQRRDARPGCCRRAAAAQWLLVHRRPPGQCLGRYRRRRAAPVADQLGPGAAPVLAVQRNGLRRLRGGRRGAPWTAARAGAGRCPHAAPATGQGRAGRVLQLRRPGRFRRSRQQRHARGRFHEQLAGRVGNHRARRRPQRRIQRPRWTRPSSTAWARRA